MVEAVVVSIIVVFLLCLYECRLQRAEAKIEAFEKWAKEAGGVIGQQSSASATLLRIADMHNDSLSAISLEVDDLQKFVACFRSLRDQVEVIQ
jgi:hypothetical protein